MRDSIISIAIVLAMLIPNSGSAFVNTPNGNGKTGKTTYIDITRGKTDGEELYHELNQKDSLENENDTEKSEMNEVAVDASDSQQSTQYADSDDATSIFIWIALFAAAIALAFSALCYYNLQKLEKERKAKAKSHKRPSQLEDVIERLASLEDQVSKLSSELSASSRKYQPVQQPTRVNVSNQPQRPVQPSSCKKYACTIMGEGFPVDSVSDRSESETIAVLTVNGNKATFVINPDESAQRRLLKNFNYSAGRISNILEKSDNPQKIVTVNPGQAELRGEEWLIVKKASVKLV